MSEAFFKTYEDFKRDNKNKNCIIYGAGVAAYCLAKSMIKSQLPYEILCFMVENIHGNTGSYFGIPVKCYKECMEYEKVPIIVGTLENLHGEIISALRQYGFQNIYILKDKEYREIRKELCDSEAEMLSLLRYLSQVGDNLLEIEQRINSQLLDLSWKQFEYIKNDVHGIAYKIEFEKMRMKPDYEDKLEKLLSNLDSKSCQEVYQIIHRLHLLCDNKKIVFSRREKDSLNNMKENFYQNIFYLQNRLIVGNYQLPSNVQAEPSVFWYKNGIEQLWQKQLDENKVIIDAGGYVGDSALILSECFSNKIYSFEADPDNLSDMKKVIEWNKLKNVVPIGKALWNKTGTVNLFNGNARTEYFVGNSCDQEAKMDVECITVDDFVAEHNLMVGLIKADIEGGERGLLEGAKKTIQEQHPSLIISIYHSIDDFFDIKPMIEEICSEYSFKVFRPVLEYTFLEETVLICEVKKQ